MPRRPSYDRDRSPYGNRPISEHALTIYGRNPVLEALRRGLVCDLAIAPRAHGETIDRIRELGAKLRVPVRESSIPDVEAEVPTQGVRARIELPEIHGDFEVLEEIVDRKPAPLVLLLDGIEDPRNFGAILRSAYAAGVDAVVFRKRRQSPLTEVVFKTSAGCAALIDMYQVTNLDQTVRTLKEGGWWVVAAAHDAQARLYTEIDWDRPTVLVLGAEGNGVSNILLKRSDLVVKIPLYRQIDSLNVSSAAAVLLFEAAKSRQLEPEI
ncbi:23S rRNA (guanosine(2251)-2'-O)-methyltransferase RlmB [bacterium]|nr:23S rRNA (guanosine(2251)-2'-O)-methyltransferase RlmB [bacterium]